VAGGALHPAIHAAAINIIPKCLVFNINHLLLGIQYAFYRSRINRG
jgi:hypothetical protein